MEDALIKLAGSDPISAIVLQGKTIVLINSAKAARLVSSNVVINE